MSEKKNTFFGGAAILAAGVALVKIIGALYKIPLANILGDTANGYFNSAYSIYSILLIVSTGGIPVSIAAGATSAAMGESVKITLTTDDGTEAEDLWCGLSIVYLNEDGEVVGDDRFFDQAPEYLPSSSVKTVKSELIWLSEGRKEAASPLDRAADDKREKRRVGEEIEGVLLRFNASSAHIR